MTGRSGGSLANVVADLENPFRHEPGVPAQRCRERADARHQSIELRGVRHNLAVASSAIDDHERNLGALDRRLEKLQDRPDTRFRSGSEQLFYQEAIRFRSEADSTV